MAEEKRILVAENPLKWPDGWTRTRIADQKVNHAWKKPWTTVQLGLEKELRKLGVTSALVTVMGDPGARDPGVALYFSRRPQEDHTWQEVLQIDSPLPTLEEIDNAFRKLALPHHPDRVSATGKGDPQLFNFYSEHRKKAKEWVLGTHTHAHDLVIACDKFKEPRWNLNAIKMTIQAIRNIERYGTTSLMERAFTGFKAALPAQATEGAA